MLKVLVGVKRVVDYAAKVRVLSDGSGVDISNTKMSMNPFCEIAVEEAVKLKEAGVASEVTVLSAGPKQATDVLRTALAMGADKAIHVPVNERIDIKLLPLAVAQMLKFVVERDGYNFVILGKQAIDGDHNQTPQMLAGMLNWPQATYLYKLDAAADGQMKATREVDGGLQIVNFKAPAVVSCDLRLNTPRFTAIPAIMKAKKKPLETLKPEDMGVDTDPHFNTLSIVPPPERSAGQQVESVDELIDKRFFGIGAAGAMIPEAELGLCGGNGGHATQNDGSQ